jgi:hypothetical protein
MVHGGEVPEFPPIGLTPDARSGVLITADEVPAERKAGVHIKPIAKEDRLVD